MTMAILTGQTGGLFCTTVVGLLALERGRFLAPVRPGDTGTAQVEVLDKRETSTPGRGLVLFRDYLLNQRSEMV
jgi:acyl dehydratase